MITRLATPADAPALTDLLNQIIHIGGSTAHEFPLIPDQFNDHYINGPHAMFCQIALADNGGVIGFQALDNHPHGLPKDWRDIGTFVAPSARGTGAGRALFAATRTLAKSQGVQVINATIRADNSAGLAYYTCIGFTDYAFDPDFTLSNGTRTGRISKRFDL